MATTTEVIKALDDITDLIVTERKSIVSSVNRMTTAQTKLEAIPTQYADVITTINAYGTTDAFEAETKARLAKMAAEYTILKNAITDANLAVADVTGLPS